MRRAQRAPHNMTERAPRVHGHSLHDPPEAHNGIVIIDNLPRSIVYNICTIPSSNKKQKKKFLYQTRTYIFEKRTYKISVYSYSPTSAFEIKSAKRWVWEKRAKILIIDYINSRSDIKRFKSFNLISSLACSVATAYRRSQASLGPNLFFKNNIILYVR